jgi:hypothetical protein
MKNNDVLLNVNNYGMSYYATGKNADILTSVVAGCLIILTFTIAIKILR